MAQKMAVCKRDEKREVADENAGLTTFGRRNDAFVLEKVNQDDDEENRR